MSFIKSAVLPKDYPEGDVPEVAVAGRSNSGKSSFLNSVFNSKLAKVSQKPGKTRLLNFFQFGKYRYVDTPGYGFASRSGDEMREWTMMIENYLTTRGNLCGLVLIMDIRRKWDQDEKLLKKFCDAINLPMILVVTKIDKCSKSELSKLHKGHLTTVGLPVFPVSSTTGQGVEEVEDFIFKNWVKEALSSERTPSSLSDKQEKR